MASELVPGGRAGPIPAVTVPESFNVADWLVDRHLREGRGERTAIVCGDQTVTYAQLAERSSRFANALRGLGARRDERVMLLLLDSPAFAYAFFGAQKVGAVPIPTNTLLRSPDYRYMLDDSRASVLVISDVLLPAVQSIPRAELPHLREIVVAGRAPAGMRSLDEVLASAAADPKTAPTHRDDVAFWLYSSGTTGFPKGAIHLHHDIVHTVELYAKPVLGIGESDRTFSVAKLFFAYGLGNALTFPLAVGATTILCPDAPAPAAVMEQVERFRPTLLFSVPTGYAQLLAQHREGPEYDLSSVRQGVSAGEALPRSIFERFRERFGVEILDGIGSTEILHIFISNRAGRVRAGSSGELVAGYEARLLDDEGAEVAAGEIGNLLIRGDSTCSGYWNKHERTKDTIEGHWIRTGDKYWRDEDGYFWYGGRTDDMIKAGGIWVSPVEIENTLLEHPAVKEAGVVAHRDQDQLQKPLAYVVLAPGQEPTGELAQELQDFVRARIAEYKRPRWIRFISELPKTATGKTQRFRLRELDQPHRPDLEAGPG
ncbi:MAG: benzoate-CoA ligase family protein [Candidatus Dormibacteraceae bacterium]